MTHIKPYGDTTNDGMVQMSFTLPLPLSERARQAAHALARNMGFEREQVAHMEAVGEGFTFFVVYASTTHSVDVDDLQVPEREFPLLSYGEVNRLIRERLKRRMVVIGACTGTDAHTVGLDAILSIKGFAGDKGLEHFSEMDVRNLGSQVHPHQIVQAAIDATADAVLVSQVVTQKDAHLKHLTEVREALEDAGLRDRLILVGGGPRFQPEQAQSLGYDRIFGKGTRPSEVASYLAYAIDERMTA